MCRCLVSKRIGCYIPVNEALQQIDNIAAHPYRYALAFSLRIQRPVYTFIYVQCIFIQVAGLHTFLHAPFFHLCRKAYTFIHGNGQWLSATHTAKPGSNIECTLQRTIKMNIRQRKVSFVSTLNNTL